MFDNRQKTGPFLLGVMVGVIITALLILLWPKQFFKSPQFSKYEETGFDVNEKFDKNAANTTTKSTSVNTKKEEGSSVNTLGDNEKMAVMASKFAAKATNSDTIRKNNQEEVIHLRKDELVFSRSVKVLNIASTVTQTKDTLLNNLAGITEVKPITTLLVEFWVSPLNYKGYRMSRSKLMLYGMQPIRDLKIYKDADEYFFRSDNEIFHLVIADEFKPMEVETNAELRQRVKIVEDSLDVPKR